MQNGPDSCVCQAEFVGGSDFSDLVGEASLMDRPVPASTSIPMNGVALLVLLCFVWGGNMVSIKVSNQGVPPILTAAFRSMVASILLWIYALMRGERVFLDRADMKHGIIIGFLFAMDFLFMYLGTSYTNASRAVIFLYTCPFWATLGAHFFLKADRLTSIKTVGILMAFAGIVSVFGSRSPNLGPLYWVGDLMLVAAALFWAATTVYIKKYLSKDSVTHFQTLFTQLFFSIPILTAATLLVEPFRSLNLTPITLGAVAYQTIVVAFLSYILWFWMIRRYPVSTLSTFTFLVPLIGVLLSGLILGETMGPLLWIGLVLVILGIYLVNRPGVDAPSDEVSTREE
jgi:drug/metabolite transporter (DMT)-like permease